MEKWKEEAEHLKFDLEMTWGELDKEMARFFPDLSPRQMHEKVRRYLRDTDRYKEKSDAYLEPVEPQVIRNKWTGDKIIRFGLMGDTQINSKYTQLTHLHKFYDICQQEGIDTVYHTGDIDEGEDMRQGHKYECYNQGADDHTEEIIRVYPQRKGITTHFVTGNHDHSIFKKVGHDIGPDIEKSRTDMKYLGRDQAFIMLTPNCSLELRHPGDGTAYAISYKIQKMVEAMSGGEKPNILAVGHYHKQDDMIYRNVWTVQTGCFQAQTPWMRSKSIAAVVGGYIIEVHVDEEGTITRFRPEFIPYLKSIKEDYKNWR
jgi:predicted phosphodiesterase